MWGSYEQVEKQWVPKKKRRSEKCHGRVSNYQHHKRSTESLN